MSIKFDFMALNIKMQLLFVCICIYLKFYFFLHIIFRKYLCNILYQLKKLKYLFIFIICIYLKNLFSSVLFLFRYNWINDKELSNYYDN